jgi:nickel-dependent lactate racemase
LKTKHVKTIAYGKGQLTFTMQHEPLPLEKIEDNNISSKKLSRKDVLQAIRSPDGTPELHEIIKADDKVILLVPDATRRAGMNQVVPVLLDELEAVGASCDNITLLFATGLHGSQTREQKIFIVGEEVCNRLPNIFDHDATDENNLVEIGNIPGVGPLEVNRRVLEADIIICMGSVRFHQIAGFSGGGKIILPGISSRKTVLNMHSQDFRKGITKSYGGTLTPNPFQQSMQEAVNILKPHYFINTVVDPYGDLLDIHAGTFESVHRKCRESVKRIYGVQVKEKVPFIIVSAGGYPLDVSWFQTVKAMIHWIRVLEDDGWIIVIGECGQKGYASKPGESNPVEQKPVAQKPTIEEVEEALKKDFTMERYGLYRIMRDSSKKNIIPVGEMDEAMAQRMNLKIVKGENATEKLNNAIKMVEAHIGRDYKYYLVKQGGSFMPILY